MPALHLKDTDAQKRHLVRGASLLWFIGDLYGINQLYK